jgi:transmembrane 9 superfamily member 3
MCDFVCRYCYQVHGDVFRQPAYLMLFSALYGTGCQIATLIAGVILFAIAGPLHGDVYEKRGEMVSFWEQIQFFA